jgi:hypothetical protein
MDHIPINLGALLPHAFTPEMQKTLADLTVKHGHLTTLPHVGPNGWTSISLRRPVDPKFDTYHSRLWPGVEWEWRDTVATGLVQEILQDLGIHRLFKRMTRMTLLAQNPGFVIRMHRDPVAQNDYGEGGMFMHEAPETPPNTWHEANRRLAITCAITTRLGDNGCPTVRFGEQDYRYETGNRFFTLNEVDMFHGARAVDFHRGVFWVDGEIDMDAYDTQPLAPISLRSLEGHTEDMPWGLKGAGVNWKVQIPPQH